MMIGQINGIAREGKDNARHSIIFRPGAVGLFFPKATSNREKRGGAIHHASTSSHSESPIRDDR
jgi:hypothetical protein